MRRVIPLLISLVFSAVLCQGTELSQTRLMKGQTFVLDGFRVRVDVGPKRFTTSRGAPFEMLWFCLSVPRKLGQTDFSRCQLMLQYSRDRTLLSVPLSIRDGTPRNI